MSRSESGFVPLPKVEQEQPEGNVRIALNLPDYVDQDRIGVNLTNIVKLGNWGGIERIAVVGKTEMETSRVTPEITGMNPDGSALASKKVTKEMVPTFEYDASGRDWLVDEIANRWKSVGITLNIDELTQRASQDQEGVRAVKSWVKELDNGIKEPIRAAGHENLLHDLERGDKRRFYTFFGLNIGWYSASFLLNDHANLSPAFLVGATAGQELISFVRSVAQKKYRFSLVPGYQVDRAAILSVSSRLKNVVKDLHQDKK